jgi:TonB family protein
LWRDIGIAPTDEERVENAEALRLSGNQIPELLIRDTDPGACGSGSGCPWHVYGLRQGQSNSGATSLRYVPLLEGQGGVYVLAGMTNGYRDLLIDGGFGGSLLKFDGTTYETDQCFSHDYKSVENIRPTACRSQEAAASSLSKQALTSHPNTLSESPGAGVSNGTARLGPAAILSDTKGADFGPYLQHLLRDVKNNWLVLIQEEARPPGKKKGKVLIELSIEGDGSVLGMKLASPSGDPSLDRAAWGGISASRPFPPLPVDFAGSNLTLRLTFLYNFLPGEN